jgi:PAS domain S-box-containing protein
MKTSTIRRDVWVFASVGFLILAATITAGFSWYQARQLRETVSNSVATTARAFKSQVENDAEVLDGLVDLLEREPSLQKAFMTGDRDALLKCALPLYKDLRKNHRVTHFYFSDPNRVCFLRVHEPSRHGDVVNRYTTTEAVNKGEPFHGIEMGPLGTLTVRAVHPWKAGNRLIGYIELGEEIDHVLPKLKNLTGVELIATIDKCLLDRDKWEAGMTLFNRKAAWDRFDGFVVVDSTLPAVSESIDAILRQSDVEREGRIHEASLATTRYRSVVMPLTDVSGIDLGHLIAFVDVTKDVLAFRKALFVGLVGALVFTGLAAVVFLICLERQQESFAIEMNESRQARDDDERTILRLATLSQAVEQSTAGVLIANVDGSLEYANFGLLELTGYASVELVGKHIQILQSDVYSPNFYKRIQALLSRGEAWRGEVCFQKRSGETFWAVAAFAPIREGENAISRVVAVVMDITATKKSTAAMLDYTESLARAGAEIRKQAKELAAREAKYRTLFDSSRDAIMILTPDEGFLDGNPAAAKMFGCEDGAEFATFSPAELSPERQPDGELSVVAAQEMMAIALEKGSHFFEWVHKRRHGADFPATVLLTRMELGGKTLLQATVRDVSEEKRLIEALRIAKVRETAAASAGEAIPC